MKKIYIAALLLCAFSMGFSQSPQMGERQQMNFTGIQQSSNKVTAIDTLEDYLNRASGAILLGSQDGGFVLGTAYFDNMGTLIPVSDGTGMHYTGVANARVTEVLTWFGNVTITGAEDSVYARVYSVNPDTTPSALLGYGSTSSGMLTSASNLVYSAIPITNGNAMTNGDDFLVSIEYPGADDTLGIVCSNPDSADGMGEMRLRQLTTASFGGSWLSIEGLWGPFDADAFIVPVIDDAVVAIDLPIGGSGLNLLGNFPNPATSTSEIRFSISAQEEVHIKVFDLAAREIYNSGWIMKEAGEHKVKVDVSTKPAGAYYYTISTHSQKLTSKLNVLK